MVWFRVIWRSVLGGRYCLKFPWSPQAGTRAPPLRFQGNFRSALLLLYVVRSFMAKFAVNLASRPIAQLGFPLWCPTLFDSPVDDRLRGCPTDGVTNGPSEGLSAVLSAGRLLAFPSVELGALCLGRRQGMEAQKKEK